MYVPTVEVKVGEFKFTAFIAAGSIVVFAFNGQFSSGNLSKSSLRLAADKSLSLLFPQALSGAPAALLLPWLK